MTKFSVVSAVVVVAIFGLLGITTHLWDRIDRKGP